MNTRAKLVVQGIVQGVGFRPFVYRLAKDLRLSGRVSNSPGGVVVEVEGARSNIDLFTSRIVEDRPRHAVVDHLDVSILEAKGFEGFEISPSETGGPCSAPVMPDVAICSDCLSDIADPRNRRFRYPFTSCTSCGPRFTIIQDLPYDRQRTCMKDFTMCPDCRREYDDPADRRFHSEINACSDCGPILTLLDRQGKRQSDGEEALALALGIIRSGGVLALKGIGGFLLLVDARNHWAVRRLRERKRRPHKPFALMVPSVDSARDLCVVSADEKKTLMSPTAPIVLLARRSDPPYEISPAVAPDSPSLGVMLPSSGVHALLVSDCGFPMIATSGNRTDEPICIDDCQATTRLCAIADAFLTHNRPILRHADDSVVRIVDGREQLLRRARGYVPFSFRVHDSAPLSVLAVGGHQKNTVAFRPGAGDIHLSQHIGSLDSNESLEVFTKAISHMRSIHTPVLVACDSHPDYASTRWAETSGYPVRKVQHHRAHIESCLLDNNAAPPVLGVAWDGAGLGDDGTIWGGECFRCDERGFNRIGHVFPFRLPGGEAAMKEPRRSAAGILYELFGERALERTDLVPVQSWTKQEQTIIQSMLERKVNSPVTTAVGRLFDAAASLLGVYQTVSFEGQAAMKLECLIGDCHTDELYELPFLPKPGHEDCILLDWRPLFLAMIDDIKRSVPVSLASARFHNTMADAIARFAGRVGLTTVALTGGCFQNAYLTSNTMAKLKRGGFTPLIHHSIPPNDGGIAAGQIAAVLRNEGRLSATREGLLL